MCRHFELPDCRSRLFREILDRTQDPSESIVDYLSSISALFQRYGDLSDEVQLDIISRNLSPFYLTQLPAVRSLVELEAECLKLKTKKYRADHYVPPSRRRQNLVKPNLAFITSTSAEPSPVCWSCNFPGHLGRECSKARKLHCFRCGAPGVTVRNCRSCIPSENCPRDAN